ncbi:hypothetical protein Hanom_Chr04g00348371 [Helianthus anomalus]
MNLIPHFQDSKPAISPSSSTSLASTFTLSTISISKNKIFAIARASTFSVACNSEVESTVNSTLNECNSGIFMTFS